MNGAPLGAACGTGLEQSTLARKLLTLTERHLCFKLSFLFCFNYSIYESGAVLHTFNPSTLEAEAGESLISRPAVYIVHSTAVRETK